MFNKDVNADKADALSVKPIVVFMNIKLIQVYIAITLTIALIDFAISTGRWYILVGWVECNETQHCALR